MSPRSTGSPVSASTGFSEMRLPVLGLIWFKRMRSASVVAGASAIGHVTSETRRWPDQLGRGMRSLSFEFRFNQGLEVPESQRVARFRRLHSRLKQRWLTLRYDGLQPLPAHQNPAP